jgi:dienelactone hydrolase
MTTKPPRGATAPSLACLVALIVGVLAQSLPAAAERLVQFGAFGPEGPRLREQLWLVPGADPNVPLRSTVFRPKDDALQPPKPRPLVVINHGSDDGREAVSMPVFYWLSRWFVERGYVVLLPQRRGHGATGGEAVEARDTCANPDHYAAGMAGAKDIDAAVRFMVTQAFIDPQQVAVVGISTGGWAALALAGLETPGVRMIVNFAGGRGGHAYGRRNVVCKPDRLIKAVAAYGKAALVPTLWFYAENDSYFGPSLATAMARAWADTGATVDLRLLPTYGTEGHGLVDDRDGWSLWSAPLEEALKGVANPPAMASVK